MKKILVIDDNKGILDTLQLVFTTFGYEARCVHSKAEALSTLETFEPDLIFLDLLLSGESGVDICKSFKQNSELQRVPIIMMSAHPSAERSISGSGASAFMSKPFALQSLMELTEKYT